MKKIDLVINYLNSKLKKNYSIENDFLDCYISIKESLIENDLEYINYKLFCNFSKELFYIGNEMENEELYVNSNEITKENVINCLEKSIDYVIKNF